MQLNGEPLSNSLTTSTSNAMLHIKNSMAKAGRGTYGASTPPEYGLCPRGVLDIFQRVQKMGNLYQLTAAAVEVSAIFGNIDLLGKVVTEVRCRVE